MQNKSKNSKWTRAEKLSLLRFITPFLVYFLNLIPKMKNALMILSKKFELKLSSLNLLIVFILLLLMILILYFRNKIKEKKRIVINLLRFIKKHIKNYHPKNIWIVFFYWSPTQNIYTSTTSVIVFMRIKM